MSRSQAVGRTISAVRIAKTALESRRAPAMFNSAPGKSDDKVSLSSIMYSTQPTRKVIGINFCG